ncbi:MAG: PH domain-containing protein [Methanomassiliicoccales archaeon]
MIWGLLFLSLFMSGISERYIAPIISMIPFLTSFLLGTVGEAQIALFWVILTLVIGLFALILTKGHRHKLIFFTFVLLVVAGIAGIRYIPLFHSSPIYFLFGLTFSAGVVAFVLADVYRRAYKYYITDFRIAIIRKFLTYNELYIRYENLVDVDVYLSIAGRLFSFGDIVPITAADIGAGQNISGQAAAGKIKLRGTEVARKLPSECMFGVRKPYRVRSEIAQYMQKSSATYELRRIESELKAKTS